MYQFHVAGATQKPADAPVPHVIALCYDLATSGTPAAMRAWTRTIPMKRTIRNLIIIVASVGPAALSCGCAPGESPPNVVLITLDTMRQDHLGCYGYARPTSPNLDAFAQSATTYTRAVATSPWTVQTHASLFTGKFPFEHGAHTFKVTSPTPNNVNPLSKSFKTIAEFFRDEGYETTAYIANAAYLSERWQLDQGFDRYVVDHVPAVLLNRRITAWLTAREERPFFLFVNYIDTHGPYNTSKAAPFLDEPASADKTLVDELFRQVMPGTGAIPSDLVDNVLDQYDTSVWIVDEQVGALFQSLKKLGLWENTIVIVTSDHGEYFGEHHLVKHSKDIYEAAMAVPLIVKGTGPGESKRVDTYVTSNDIPGIIASWMPFRLAAKLFVDFPDLPGNHPVIGENYYSRPHDIFNPVWGHRFKRVRTAVYDWPYKLIYSSDEKHELYNLDTDPGESENLLEQKPDVASRLQKTWMDFQEKRQRSDELIDQDPLTEEQLEKLRSLGYIGN